MVHDRPTKVNLTPVAGTVGGCIAQFIRPPGMAAAPESRQKDEGAGRQAKRSARSIRSDGGRGHGQVGINRQARQRARAHLRELQLGKQVLRLGGDRARRDLRSCHRALGGHHINGHGLASR